MTPIFPRAARALDYWRVNSYGYPCFFSDHEKSQEAWATLLTFFDFTDYEALKASWSKPGAPRQLSPHAVESWKATFEEFGILFVESRSNRITITPAGIQLREAVMARPAFIHEIVTRGAPFVEVDVEVPVPILR